MITPSVTVVMPVFNQACYVRAAIDSILNQTVSKFEFLIVDDGSTDGTSHVLHAVTDSRIRVIRIPHSGFLTALRTGVEAASGDLVARMDSDDLCHPKRLERQIAFLEAHPECVFVTTYYGLVTPRGYFLAPKQSFDWKYVTAADITQGNGLFCDPGTIFHRRQAVSAGLYDSEFENEKPLWYKLLRYGQGAVLGASLYYARWLVSSHSRDESGLRRRRQVHRLIRLKYDPEGATKIPAKARKPQNEPLGISVARRAIGLYLLAGDKASAREVAIKAWKRFPNHASSWAFLLRGLTGRSALRFWSSPQAHPVYQRTPSPW